MFLSGHLLFESYHETRYANYRRVNMILSWILATHVSILQFPVAVSYIEPCAEWFKWPLGGHPKGYNQLGVLSLTHSVTNHYLQREQDLSIIAAVVRRGCVSGHNRALSRQRRQLCYQQGNSDERKKTNICFSLPVCIRTCVDSMWIHWALST